MTIAAVGTLTSGNASGMTNLSFSSVNTGALAVLATLIISPTLTVSSVAGHGATWLPGPRLATGASGVTIELWMGKILTTGTSNITTTWSSSNAGVFTAMDCLEFNAGLGRDTVWQIDLPTGGQDNASATTCSFPSLTPDNPGSLYVAHAYGDSIALAAPGTGATTVIDASDNAYAYNVSVSSAVTAATSATAAQSSHSIAMIVSASLPARQDLSYTARRRAANW